jgi:hypothetical protein
MQPAFAKATAGLARLRQGYGGLAEARSGEAANSDLTGRTSSDYSP